MREDNEFPYYDSMRPISKNVLPNTIRSKPKTGKMIYYIWYLGFCSLITAAIFCFSVVIPSQERGQLYIFILAILITIVLCTLFLLLKKIIDMMNQRP